MLNYLLLNLVFAIVIIVVLRTWRLSRPQILTLIPLLVLTAVFDSLIIYYGIVGYDLSQISGVYIGKAPIEDFFYTIVAVMIVPYFWHKFKKDTP